MERRPVRRDRCTSEPTARAGGDSAIPVGGGPPKRLLPAPFPLPFEAPCPRPCRDASRDPGALRAAALAQLLAKPFERKGAVPVLTPLIARRDHDPCGTMRQPDPGVCRVLVLTALPAGAEGVHAALREELCIGLGNQPASASCGLPWRRLGHNRASG